MKNLTNNFYTHSENFSDLLYHYLHHSENLVREELPKDDKRIGNPKITYLEQRIAALEKGKNAIAVKSLYAAKILLIRNLVSEGENVVTYSNTTLVKDKPKLEKLEIEIRFADTLNAQALLDLIDEKTKFIYLETISKVDFFVPEFRQIIEEAHEKNIPVVVDNSAGAAGYIFSPANYDADVIIETTRNWLNETDNALGALIIDTGKYNWTNGKFKKIIEGISFFDLGKNAYSIDNVEFSFLNFIRKQGNIHHSNYAIPENPFSLIKNIETIKETSQVFSRNSLNLARFLKDVKFVRHVEYLGLPTHNSHFTAHKYLRGGFGNYLNFYTKLEKDDFEVFSQQLIRYSLPVKVEIDVEEVSQKFSLVVRTLNYENLLQIFLLAERKLEEHRQSRNSILVN